MGVGKRGAVSLSATDSRHAGRMISADGRGYGWQQCVTIIVIDRVCEGVNVGDAENVSRGVEALVTGFPPKALVNPSSWPCEQDFLRLSLSCF